MVICKLLNSCVYARGICEMLYKIFLVFLVSEMVHSHDFAGSLCSCLCCSIMGGWVIIPYGCITIGGWVGGQ